MRRGLRAIAAALVAGVLATGCGGGGSTEGAGPGGDPPATGLRDDGFPCDLATQVEITTVAGAAVAYDEIEPDGQTCVYILSGPGSAHVDISVLTGEDRERWSRTTQSYPTWTTGADLGGKAVAGLGDDAFLTETPGYSGQLDIWRSDTLLRITVDVARRLSDSEVDGLIALGRTVVGRIPG